MAFDPPLIDGVEQTGAGLRRMDTMMLMADGTAGGARGGVRPGDPGLTVSVTGTVINVTSGVASVPYTGQGVYRAYGEAWTGVLAGAHPTLPRVDLVYLRVWDGTVDASGLAKADVVYLAGTPASSPVAPVPAGTQIFVRLATVSVPAVSPGGPAAVDTSVRPVTVAPGGIGVGAAFPGVHVGQYRDTGAGLQRYDGTGWHDVSFDGGLSLNGGLVLTNSNVNTNPIISDAPAGQSARLQVMRVGGVDRFSMTAAGNLTLAGGLTLGDTAWQTYTPAVSGGGSVTWTSRTGQYYRLGKIVYVNIMLQVNAAGSGSTNFQISMPSAVDRTMQQTIFIHGEGIKALSQSTVGCLIFFTSGSGAVADRVRLQSGVTGTGSLDNRVLNTVGSDLLPAGYITVQGWYREA